jgi:hypothetical protein
VGKPLGRRSRWEDNILKKKGCDDGGGILSAQDRFLWQTFGTSDAESSGSATRDLVSIRLNTS